MPSNTLPAAPYGIRANKQTRQSIALLEGVCEAAVAIRVKP